MVENLVSVIGKPFNLQEAMEDDLVFHILEQDAVYNITYDA